MPSAMEIYVFYGDQWCKIVWRLISASGSREGNAVMMKRGLLTFIPCLC